MVDNTDPDDNGSIFQDEGKSPNPEDPLLVEEPQTATASQQKNDNMTDTGMMDRLLPNFVSKLMVAAAALIVTAVIVEGAVCGTGHCSANDPSSTESTFVPSLTTTSTSAPTTLAPTLLEETPFGNENITGNNIFNHTIDSPTTVLYPGNEPNTTDDDIMVLLDVVDTDSSILTNASRPTNNNASSLVEAFGLPWDQWTTTKIDLHSSGLSGTLPTELGLLRQLRDIWLWNNTLSGTIPTELGLLTQLTNIHFATNRLYGSIPSELGLTKLTALSLRDNVLDGRIASELGLLTRLTYLALYINRLTGPFGDWIVDTIDVSLCSYQSTGRKPPIRAGIVDTEFGGSPCGSQPNYAHDSLGIWIHDS